MNNYITLNSLKYKTRASDWVPVTVVPGTHRALLSGSADVTFGPSTFSEFRGTIIVPEEAGEESEWGDRADITTVIGSRETIIMNDHFGNELNVVVFGEFPQQSVSPMWDAPSNEWYIPVRIIVL